MAWIEAYDTRAAGERAQRALRFPVGVASPLWAIFGAAASGAVAYWWLTHWARPVNAGAEAVAKIEVKSPASRPSTGSGAAAIAVEAPLVATPAVAASAHVEPAPDDLTRMRGIGPKLSLALAARGVTRFAQIAAWTGADLAEVDAALGLKGRAVREAWVEQARELAADS